MHLHPDLNCGCQNTVLIIYTLCTILLTPVLVPLQLHKYKASCKTVNHFTRQNPRMYTMKALSNGSAVLFMFLIYTMALLMKCMLSFNNYQSTVKQQEHINIRKVQINQKPKRKLKIHSVRPPILNPPPPHQLTVNVMHQIHAVHCWGTF